MPSSFRQAANFPFLLGLDAPQLESLCTVAACSLRCAAAGPPYAAAARPPGGPTRAPVARAQQGRARYAPAPGGQPSITATRFSLSAAPLSHFRQLSPRSLRDTRFSHPATPAQLAVHLQAFDQRGLGLRGASVATLESRQ